MNINRKSENFKRFCCPKTLEKKMNVSPKRHKSQNFRNESLKSSLLKKTKRVPPTSFRVKAKVHLMHVSVSFTPHRMNEYFTEL